MFVKNIYVYLNFNAVVFFSLPLLPKLRRIQQCEIFLDFLWAFLFFVNRLKRSTGLLQIYVVFG